VKLKFFPKQVQKVTRSISVSDVSLTTPEEAKVTPLEDLEKRAIEVALMKYHGNISIVAKKLKIGQATLYRKVKKYGFSQWSKMAGSLS
jgi:transcriptional regulator with PAS, ATPase and Fis domain